MVVMFVVESN